MGWASEGSGPAVDRGIGSAGADAAPLLSVLVPVYNGADLVPDAHRAITDALELDGRDYELVFVDDGSTDATWTAIRRVAESDPRVIAIRLEVNVGQAAATAAGIPHTSGDPIVTIDVDLETDARDLPRIVAAIEQGHAVASGRRTSRRIWRRELPSWMFNLYVRSTGIPLHDIGCGTNAMQRRVALAYAETGDIGRELPTAILTGLTDDLVEIPMRSRRPEGSQLSYRQLAALWLAFERRRTPSPAATTALAATGAITWVVARQRDDRLAWRLAGRSVGGGLVLAALVQQAAVSIPHDVSATPRPRVIDRAGARADRFAED